MPNDLGPLDPGVLRQLIGERGADSAWLTASLFNTLVDLDPDCLGGLRQLLTGGDILSVPHVRRAPLRHPRLHLVNGYGPTENTTFTCCHVVTDDDLEEDDIPIGKAIAGTAVLLLDEHGQEIAEPDRAGEIVAFGAGPAQGYRNDAARTRASFVELPYRGRLLRAYRTGDRARYDEQGRLRFIGRGDGQVKLNGYRLDLPPWNSASAASQASSTAPCWSASATASSNCSAPGRKSRRQPAGPAPPTAHLAAPAYLRPGRGPCP